MTTIDVGDPRLPERFWDKVQVVNKRRNIRNCRICARAQWKKWDQNRRAGQ